MHAAPAVRNETRSARAGRSAGAGQAGWLIPRDRRAGCRFRRLVWELSRISAVTSPEFAQREAINRSVPDILECSRDRSCLPPFLDGRTRGQAKEGTLGPGQ